MPSDSVKIAAIQDVSDTALWVAAYRALETQRPDSVFQDPLAELLVGERGHAIAKSLAASKIMAWSIVARTCAIDRLIQVALSQGVDTVINLGAGLDTRPYRMELPSHLRWIEIDFENLITLKNKKLLHEIPKCKLERVVFDLSDPKKRSKYFAKLATQSKKSLVLTEGLVPYLTPAAVESLSQDLLKTLRCSYWIQDYYNGGLNRRVPRSWRKKLKAAPFQFEEKNWIEYFTRRGWRVEQSITTGEEAQRMERPFPFIFPWSLILALLPRKWRVQLGSVTGYVLLANDHIS